MCHLWWNNYYLSDTIPLPPSTSFLLHFQTTALMMCMVGRWKKKWLSLQVQQVHMFTVTADPENNDEKFRTHAVDF